MKLTSLVVLLTLLIGCVYGAAGDYTTTGNIKSRSIELAGTAVVISASNGDASARLVNVSASNLIQVGASAQSCTASVSGSIRFSTASNTLQVCTGSLWASLSSATTSGVISATSGYFGNVAASSASLNAVMISATNINLNQQADGASPRIAARQISNGRSGGIALANTSGGPAYLWIDGPGVASLQRGSVNDYQIGLASSGNVGISNSAPMAKLDVNGTISASDVVQVASTSTVCTAGIAGGLRYSSVSGTVQVCTSGAWTSLSSGSTVATVPANVSLSNISATGTISANNFIGNGAGITGIFADGKVSQSWTVTNTTIVTVTSGGVTTARPGATSLTSVVSGTLPGGNVNDKIVFDWNFLGTSSAGGWVACIMVVNGVVVPAGHGWSHSNSTSERIGISGHGTVSPGTSASTVLDLRCGTGGSNTLYAHACDGGAPCWGGQAGSVIRAHREAQ